MEKDSWIKRYSEINVKVIWDIIVNKLPNLKVSIIRISKELKYIQ